MSGSGAVFVAFAILSIFSLVLEWPTWIFVLLTLAMGVFEIVAIDKFDKMQERVNKLENELKQRKDGKGDG